MVGLTSRLVLLDDKHFAIALPSRPGQPVGRTVVAPFATRPTFFPVVSTGQNTCRTHATSSRSPARPGLNIFERGPASASEPADVHFRFRDGEGRGLLSSEFVHCEASINTF